MVAENVDQSRIVLATDLVKKYMWWTMGAGLIPVPLVDVLTISGVQLKMLKEISDIYEIKFNDNKGKSIIAALLGSVVPNSLAFGGLGSLLKIIPLIGPLVGGVSMSLFSGGSYLCNR